MLPPRVPPASKAQAIDRCNHGGKQNTMHKFSLFIVIAITFFCFGCSTVRVSQDYDTNIDFSTMKTYAWQHDTQPKTGNIRLDNELEDRRIRSAIDGVLRNKGYGKVDRAAADFLVGYQRGIQQKVKSDGMRTGIGIGMGRRGGFGSIGISTGADVETYDEGMLVIDVSAPDSGALLWRGTGTGTVSPHAKQEKRIQSMNEAVSKILEPFPPQPAK